MQYPDHMSHHLGRSFYYADAFHQRYFPTAEDPEVRMFAGGFVIHWDNLLVTQALISLLSLGGILVFGIRSNESKRHAEHDGDGNADERV